MIERIVKISNRRGLHARAAAKFATVAERFQARIEVTFEDRCVEAASIMGLMMLGAGCGSTLTLRALGTDESEALEALRDLIESGFNETD